MFEFVSGIDILTAVVIDLFVLTACTILLLRYGRLAHSHPAVIYLVFHILVVPSRLLALLSGAETLFTRWGGLFEPVTESEIVRAALLSDLALIVMTIAWVRVAFVSRKKSAQADPDNPAPVTLSLRHIWSVVAVAFPIGVIGLALLGSIPGIEKPEMDLGDWQESSWLAVTITWAGLTLLALIYWYGFRLWLMAPMMIYLFIMGIQGYHRFRVIIPILLMIQIYLDRHQKKWPPLRVIVVILCVLLLFFPMKTIGRMAQEGETYFEITQSSSEIVKDALSGQAGDQTVLDQFASTLTLVDRAGKYYYGAPYLALLTSPIPRQWWPDKPTLSAHIYDFSTPTRPMAELGMVASFLGDLYLNFGFFGIVILSYLSAYSLGRVYFLAYDSNYFSILRFSYLMVACNLIQIYRDGPMSLIIFTVVNMMPLAMITFLHILRPVRVKRESVPLYSAPMSSR